MYTYIAWPNIAKPEMAEYYIADVGWFGPSNILNTHETGARRGGVGESQIYVL